LSSLFAVAELFKSEGKVEDVQEYGNGNVNDTYLVTLECSAHKHFILQRINTRVFRQPQLVMSNMLTVTDHILNRLEQNPVGTRRRFETPRVLLTEEGRSYFTDSNGAVWRAVTFIQAARSFDAIQDVGHAEEIGYALGAFHSLISDLPSERLADTLPGFHITPLYLRHYDEVAANNPPLRSSEVDYAVNFIVKRRSWTGVLEDARTSGKLKLRPIHGDPKVNNVMIDNVTRLAVSVVDLDTVQPGLLHYDIGDMLRSGCNPIGEEIARWEEVRFELDLCRAILQGYLSVAKDFLAENDYEYFFDAIRLIAFELGLRFFTDYLEGNVYFKVRWQEHNLFRALVQFKLTESIELQEAAIRKLIREIQ